jgi:hypothetical protein
MTKYKVIPVDIALEPKEFEAEDDFHAIATIGMYAGTTALEVQKEVNLVWAHLTNLKGLATPVVGPPPGFNGPISRLENVG